MKYKIFLAAVLGAAMLASCDKVDVVTTYKNGTTPVLTSSATTVAPAVGDSDNVVVTFSWSDPKYANADSTTKYVLQIDTAGDNFKSPLLSITESGSLDTSFTGGQIESLVYSTLGLPATMPFAMQVRVISSYANNNEQYTSNAVTVNMTAYVPAFPNVAANPVPVPTTGMLFLVGDATQGGWNNPVPVPSQQFTQVNSNYYTLTIPLIGGNQYLMLPLNGDWGNKFAVNDNTVSGLSSGGYFGFNLSQNFPAPASSGTYLIRVRFDLGYFDLIKVGY